MSELSRVTPSQEEAMRAMMARDGTYDGAFVFGCTTTHVYCRPSCPSRRPSVGNVRIFADPTEAERSGFRPCKRCDPRGMSPAQRSLNLVERASELLTRNSATGMSLDDLSHELGVNKFRLQKEFKRVMGLSPRQYLEQSRIARVKGGLRIGLPVRTAVYGSGYKAQSWMYSGSRWRLGMTPAAYRRGGEGAKIGYATGDSPIGRVLVAATEFGVCSVVMGRDDVELVRSLRREFPNASLSKSKTAQAYLTAVLAHLGGQLSELPLDVDGTSFQRKVWAALGDIPPGETRSYGQVAVGIGIPSASRAVARACAANPVPLLIPCHRVVRGDGSPGGYRYGAQRKRDLILFERTKAWSGGESPT